MESQQERYYTVDEYFALEEQTPEKNEYFDGRIYAMAGSSLNHAQITVNVLFHLGLGFRGRSCRIFNSDVKVHVVETGLHTYPDVSALCGEPRFEDRRQAVLLNPTMLVEVLSPSTEGYDRGTKGTHYRTIPTLQEYVLIAQDEARIERFTRRGDPDAAWALTVVNGLDASVELPSVDCTLALRDVYEHVELPPRPPLRAVYERPADYVAANF